MSKLVDCIGRMLDYLFPWRTPSWARPYLDEEPSLLSELALPLTLLVLTVVGTYFMWTRTETGRMLIFCVREFPYYPILVMEQVFGGWAR